MERIYKKIAPLVLALFLVVSCATFAPDTKDVDFKYKFTGDFIALGDTLKTTRNDISAYCLVTQNQVTSELTGDCIRAKNLFDIAVNSYSVVSEYHKAIHDPDNMEKYAASAVFKATDLSSDIPITYSEADTLIQSIKEITESTEETDPAIKALRIMTIVNTRMLPVITDIIIRGN